MSSLTCLNLLLVVSALVSLVVSARLGHDEAFKRQVSLQGSSCDVMFRNHTGFITTPNYPSEYNPNQNCTYTIQPDMPANTQFSVTFYACDCHVVGYSTDCLFDYFTIGSDRTPYCGILTGFGTTVYSTDGKVVVNFVTGDYIAWRGFRLAYVVNSELLDISDLCPSDAHFELFSDTGFIKTPNYPARYNSNQVVTFSLSQPTDFTMHFYVCDGFLQMPFDINCPEDRIQFGFNTTAQCGYLTHASFTASSVDRRVKVTFSTDDLVELRGCNIAYSTSMSGADLQSICPPPRRA